MQVHGGRGEGVKPLLHHRFIESGFQSQQAIDLVGYDHDHGWLIALVGQLHKLGAVDGGISVAFLQLIAHHRGAHGAAIDAGEVSALGPVGVEGFGPVGLHIDGIGQYESGVGGDDALGQELWNLVGGIVRHPRVDVVSRGLGIGHVVELLGGCTVVRVQVIREV